MFTECHKNPSIIKLTRISTTNDLIDMFCPLYLCTYVLYSYMYNIYVIPMVS